MPRNHCGVWIGLTGPCEKIESLGEGTIKSQFVQQWRAFFTRLERLHGLDINKFRHIWLLQLLCLDAINQDCMEFQMEWNLHLIAGPTTNNRSPQDLQLLSIATHGTYSDEYDGIDPHVIECYYGIHGREVIWHPGHTSAGHPDDEDLSKGHHLISQIEDDQQQHVHHDTDEARFFGMLETIIIEGIIPEGYGCLPGELDDEDAEMIEVLEFGLWGKKHISISLTEPIWSRTKLWAQALDILSGFNVTGCCPSE
ncbi:hypothetical protein OG21DRAFT_1478686 [Imleria badia]|nr:hypothetical protein OG21DRAFT_1478686 [Imleria badia]